MPEIKTQERALRDQKKVKFRHEKNKEIYKNRPKKEAETLYMRTEEP